MIRLGGISMFSRDSGGGITLASYHPRTSGTWYWAVALKRDEHNMAPYRQRQRTGQWHDYYRLPLGWMLIVSQQDWHKSGVAS